MQNPIGWCCDWLKIPQLARGILSQSLYQWLVRAILHQAQGVFPVFVLSVATGFLWQLLTTLTWVVTISGNYSGGFLIANCAGKKCTARCSQRVAQRFSDVCTLWSSYQWTNISAEPHVAFYVNDQAKTKVFFRLGCIFSDFRFETIIVLAFTVEVMEKDNLFTRFVTVAI